MRKQDAKLNASMSAWATALGMESRTLQRLFSKAGFDVPKPGEKIGPKRIFAVVAGDQEAEKTRLVRAQADKQERENRIADAQLIPLEDNLRWQNDVLGAIRQRLLALSGEAAHLCNPTDPPHAQAQLDLWVKNSLPILRADIGKVPV